MALSVNLMALRESKEVDAPICKEIFYGTIALHLISYKETVNYDA